MNHQPNSYDLDQCEIELIEKLMKCYSYCQKIRPELKYKIIFDVKQANDAGLSNIEDDADSINLLASLQDNGIIRKFSSYDPFDYSSPDDAYSFPGRIVIDVYDDFKAIAEDRILSLKKKIGSQKNGRIIIYYSPNNGGIRTTEEAELSTKKFIIKENRKVLMNCLFNNYNNKTGGLTAKNIIESIGYKSIQGVNKSVSGINKQFLDKLKKTEKLIINDNGYKLNGSIYTILKCD